MAVELISKIKPKNNGDFKLVDVEDIESVSYTNLTLPTT